jgi:hypothetical protein
VSAGNIYVRRLSAEFGEKRLQEERKMEIKE